MSIRIVRNLTYLLVFLASFNIQSIAQASPANQLSPAFGGAGGSSFLALPPPNTRIHSVKVCTSKISSNLKVIAGIQFKYRKGNSILNGPYIGGSGNGNGNKRCSTFNIRTNEVITLVSGRAGKFLDSITIKTNRNKTKSWGGGGGSPFELHGSVKNPIIGLWGRSGALIDAIGVVSGDNVIQTGHSNAAGSNPLKSFKPTAQNDGKADNVTQMIFPNAPSDNDFSSWIRHYNSRLETIINQIAKGDSGLKKFWDDEDANCKNNDYCRMTYRREAVAYLTGVK